MKRDSIVATVLAAFFATSLIACDGDDSPPQPTTPDAGVLDGATIGDAGGERVDGVSDSDGGGGDSDGGSGSDGGGDLACVERVLGDRPETALECATCTCTSCEPESVACDEAAGCQGQVDCADTVVANGTCDGTDAACVIGACAPGEPALLLLLCLQQSCLADCT